MEPKDRISGILNARGQKQTWLAQKVGMSNGTNGNLSSYLASRDTTIRTLSIERIRAISAVLGVPSSMIENGEGYEGFIEQIRQYPGSAFVGSIGVINNHQGGININSDQSVGYNAPSPESLAREIETLKQEVRRLTQENKSLTTQLQLKDELLHSEREKLVLFKSMK